MSAEIVSWKTGACQASVSLRAIVLRVDVSGISSTSPAAGAAAAARSAASRLARSTSSATMRPSGPRAAKRGELDAPLARDAGARAARP